MLGDCEVFDRVGVVRRMLGEMIRYLIELRVVRSLLENVRYSIELRVVRSLLGDCEVFDRVESCKENC